MSRPTTVYVHPDTTGAAGAPEEGHRPMSVMDDVLNGKDPEQRIAEFCTKAELRTAWATAKDKERKARIQAEARPKDGAAAAELEAATEELDELRTRVQGALLRFVFHPVDRPTFDELKGQHRPTEKQRTEARKNGTQPPEWNLDGFAPALVAASCVELTGPSGKQDGLTEEQAQAIFTSARWNEAERAELFHTALGAYLSRTQLDGVTLGNG